MWVLVHLARDSSWGFCAVLLLVIPSELWRIFGKLLVEFNRYHLPDVVSEA